ncbi:MAG: extracellular solute-binding protein, partial [Anaerolineales bacterium]|nr:extracellular solute-binding protein [Anaerolineales bacterium]
MARNKVLLWAFALLMVAVLAACGGGNNAANGSTQPTEADAPAVVAGTPETAVDEPAPSVSLRLSVSLTPQELESFQAALDQVTAVHPEWSIELELIPQQGVVEKVSTQLAGNDLPDVFRAQGLLVQQWVRQGAFLDLTPFIEQSGLDMGEFYDGPVDQFRWNGELYGIPDTAAPDVVFYNKDMFDAAGLAYPTDEWTYDDMRDAALLLTLDENGRNATDPDFDPEAIVQWGWNG